MLIDAIELVAKGDGGLVSSVFSDDRKFLEEMTIGLAPYHGRIYLGGKKVAEYATGPGLVLPSCVHGGPGRAGAGEELGRSSWRQTLHAAHRGSGLPALGRKDNWDQGRLKTNKINSNAPVLVCLDKPGFRMAPCSSNAGVLQSPLQSIEVSHHFRFSPHQM